MFSWRTFVLATLSRALSFSESARDRTYRSVPRSATPEADVFSSASLRPLSTSFPQQSHGAPNRRGSSAAGPSAIWRRSLWSSRHGYGLRLNYMAGENMGPITNKNGEQSHTPRAKYIPPARPKSFVGPNDYKHMTLLPKSVHLPQRRC